jgi:hypothetical protein
MSTNADAVIDFEPRVRPFAVTGDLNRPLVLVADRDEGGWLMMARGRCGRELRRAARTVGWFACGRCGLSGIPRGAITVA